MHRNRLRTWILLTGLSLAVTAPALAADETNVTAGLTAAGAPLALHGFDPVAYFTTGAPAEASATFAAVHDGATYYFASRKHLDAFTASPDRYAPQFGGFCAFGVSVGKKFDGDPRYWKISDGRLYVNLNAEIAEKFNEDVRGSVAKAETHWRSIAHTPVRDL